MATQNQQSPSPLFDTLDNIRNTANNLSINSTYQVEFDHTLQFLYSYRGSQATFNAYRRELERLLQWSWHVNQTSIQQLSKAHIEQFIEFCQHPPKTWLGCKQVPRFIVRMGQRTPNPQWRPFFVRATKPNSNKPAAYRLSPKAIQATFAILGSFYNYLIQEEFIAHNPVAQIRQKSKYFRQQQQKKVIRRLTELQWSYVLETAHALAEQNSQHERTLFILNALYGMYLRISELVASSRWQPAMGDFFRDHDDNWWFKTVGKGNKERQISVSDAMLGALKRYRVSMGLSELPSPGDTTPLIMKAKSLLPINSTRQIRNIVQTCFNESVERLIRDGFNHEADVLKTATVHWLRHTGISDDVKIRPREHVRDDAGHGSSAVTDLYIDVELRERHASAKKKRIDPNEE